MVDDILPLKTFNKGGEVAVQLRYKDFYVLISVRRIVDIKEVQAYVKKYELEKPASTYTVKYNGFKIVVDHDKVDLFSYSKTPIEIGKSQWIYNVKRSSSSRSDLFFISLNITSASKVVRVDFNTEQQIDAAIQMYKSACEKAEFTLRQEFIRIANEALYKASKPAIPTPSTLVAIDNKPSTKRIVRFKSRS
jgi:hypothetical protein